MDRLISQVETLAVYFLTALIWAFAAFAVWPSWRQNPLWLVAAVGCGMSAGGIAAVAGLAPAYQHIIAAAVALTTPATIAGLQGKSLFDLVEDLDAFRDQIRRKKKPPHGKAGDGGGEGDQGKGEEGPGNAAR